MSFALTNPLTADNLIALLQTIINGLIQLAIPITVIMILWAAFLYITSRGQGIERATKALIWAALGFGLLLIASGIISIIQDFLGVKNPGTGVTTQGPSTLADVLKILTDISGWLFTFAIIAGVGMIIVAGLSYMFARDDAGRASRAAKILLYAVVGVAVATLAWAIINIVSNFLTGKPIFATLITSVHAASVPLPPQRPSNAPTGGPATIHDIYELIRQVVSWLFTFSIIIGVGIIIFAGFRYMLAKGDAKAAGGATSMLLYAIVGIAIIALAWAIINLVGNVFVGKQILNP